MTSRKEERKRTILSFDVRWQDARDIQKVPVGGHHIVLRPLPERYQGYSGPIENHYGTFIMHNRGFPSVQLRQRAFVGPEYWLRESFAIIVNNEFFPNHPEDEGYEEFWSHDSLRLNKDASIEYKADHPNERYPGDWPEDDSGLANLEAPKWGPPSSMPMWASRARVKIESIEIASLWQSKKYWSDAPTEVSHEWDEMIRFRHWCKHREDPLVWVIGLNVQDVSYGPITRFS